jgi:hypothetical protein
MRLRFGVGERIGPFWAGLSMSPRRYFDNNPHSDSLLDAPSFGCGCAIALIFTGTVLFILVGLAVGLVLVSL